MSGASPFGKLTVAPDELRQFAALAPLGTISPVSANVAGTPSLSGPMPESAAPDTHVRFCTEQTRTVTAEASDGISKLAEAALEFANSFEATDLANAAPLTRLADVLGGAIGAGGTIGTEEHTGDRAGGDAGDRAGDPADQRLPQPYPPEERNSWRLPYGSGSGDAPSATV